MKLKFIALSLRALLDWPSTMPQALGAHPHIGTRTQLVEKDGAAVRAYVRQNLLLGLMCMEVAPSDLAFASIVSALRVAKCCAEAPGNEYPGLLRVIEGCEGPLATILRRGEAGAFYALHHERATLHAATTRVLDLLTTIPDPDLVCAYELDQLYRRAAKQADTTRSNA